jgi:hypothetical protein
MCGKRREGVSGNRIRPFGPRLIHQIAGVLGRVLFALLIPPTMSGADIVLDTTEGTHYYFCFPLLAR